MKILLASDDFDSADILAYGLRRRGFTAVYVGDSNMIVNRYEEEEPDIILLEQNSSALGAIEACNRIRASCSAPLIVLAPQAPEDVIVSALDSGVDDFILKPISARQLAARLRAVARRSRKVDDRQTENVDLILEDVAIRPDSREVEKSGRRVLLTSTEFRIYHRLAQNLGKVVASRDLVWSAWGSSADAISSNRLRTHVSRLRKKLQLSRNERGYIRAVSGLGYRLEV